MPEPLLLHLARDLERLGCELEHCGYLHAMQGFLESGPIVERFRGTQRGVLLSADKIERELKSAVRHNPASLVGVAYPLNETLDFMTTLRSALEEIKRRCVFAGQVIPCGVRAFTIMVVGYLHARGRMTV